jgi:hypothetical protein
MRVERLSIATEPPQYVNLDGEAAMMNQSTCASRARRCASWCRAGLRRYHAFGNDCPPITLALAVGQRRFGMRTHERYPARWPADRQGLLVCTALAGALVVGASGALLGLSSSIWEWATAFGGVGAGAIFWVSEVLF